MVDCSPARLQVRVAPASTSDAVRVPETELVPAKVLPWSLMGLVEVPGVELGAEAERRVT